MIDPISERRAPIPPQLAMRVAVVGVVGFALFTIIFFRLWYLQVLSGEQYLRQAQVNKVRTERIAAPRGEIKDRTGATLVENEKATVITLDPRNIPDVEKELAAEWGKAFGRRQTLVKRRRARAPGEDRQAARGRQAPRGSRVSRGSRCRQRSRSRRSRRAALALRRARPTSSG